MTQSEKTESVVKLHPNEMLGLIVENRECTGFERHVKLQELSDSNDEEDDEEENVKINYYQNHT